MGIYWFLASTIFLLFVAWKKTISLISAYGVFAIFQLLYNLIPWAASEADISIHGLLGDRVLISCQIEIAASANLAFGLAHLLFHRNVPFPISKNLTTSKSRKFALSLLPLFAITIILVYNYGWNALGQTLNEGGSVGGLYGLTSYAKQLMVAAYLYHIYRFGLDKWAWVIFSANMAIMVVDGARSTGFPIMILTLMIWGGQLEKHKRTRVYLILFLAVFGAIGTRSLIVGGSTLVEKMAIPVTVEGLMGSYSSLQSIYAIQHHTSGELAYTYGGSYIVDPLLWLPPQGGAPRAEPSLFNTWVHSIFMILPDEFAPMGGFYFVSEAVAAFSYIGPFFVAGGYALLLILMERNKRKWYIIYLAFIASIGMLFVKTIFGNAFKLFVFQLGFLTVFLLARRLKIMTARLLGPGPHGISETAEASVD